MFYKTIIKENFLPVVLFVFIIASIAVSYVKYVVKMDYNLVVRTECLPDIAGNDCVTNGESEYLKILINAREMSRYCQKSDQECVLNMVRSKKAKVLECDSSIESDETCIVNNGI